MKGEEIEDELLQRFFETVYFFFKCLKKSKIFLLSNDYLSKDLNMAIKCTMQINIQRENSFKFEEEIKFKEIDNIEEHPMSLGTSSSNQQNLIKKNKISYNRKNINRNFIWINPNINNQENI